MESGARQVFEFGSFRLDPTERTLSCNGKAVPLPPKAFDTLVILVQNRGRMVHKDELLKQVWPQTFVEENNLNKNISVLRKALGEQAVKWIEAIPKHGYRFTAEVSEVDCAAALPVEPQVIETKSDAAIIAASPSRRRLAYLAAVAVAIVAVAGALLMISRIRQPEPAVIQFAVPPPPNTTFSTRDAAGNLMALSPDGRNLVFSALSPDGRKMLWIRPLEEQTARPLAGTEDGGLPFWSPDSREIGFVVGGKVKRIDLKGGGPQLICAVAQVYGAAWGSRGVILIATSSGPLLQVSAEGGTPTPIQARHPTHGEVTQRQPSFLPDGRRFLYCMRASRPEDTGVYIASLRSPVSQRVLAGDTNAVYAPPHNGRSGHLLFVRARTLMAQPFDPDSLRQVGEPFPIAPDVRFSFVFGADFSISANGILAYRSRSPLRLTWFDRQGNRFGTLGAPGTYQALTFSRDAKRLAVDREDPKSGAPDIWVIDLQRGAEERFTFAASADYSPVWSPDGTEMLFGSTRSGTVSLYRKATNGLTQERRILNTLQAAIPTSWSPDGRYILYSQLNPKTGCDIWVLPLSGDGQPFPFRQTEFTETWAEFSPDGRWIAYASDESSRFEVYVQPFSGTGEQTASKLQISLNGGSLPRWGSDGRELFFLSGDGSLMATRINTEAGGFRPDIPIPLFKVPMGDNMPLRHPYDVHPEGKRFLVAVPVEDLSPLPIHIVVNWLERTKGI